MHIAIISKYYLLENSIAGAASFARRPASLLTSAFSHLHHVPNFVLTWGTFFSAGLLLWICGFPKRPRSRSLQEVIACCVPFNPFTSKSFHTDVKVTIVRALTDAIFIVPEVIAIVVVAGGMSHLAGYLLGQHAPIKLTTIGFAICTVSGVVAIELGEYVNHYANHKMPFLWEMHKLHHAAEILNPLTDKRAHPFAITLKILIVGPIAGIPAGLFLYCFGIDVPALVVASQASIQAFRYCTLDPLKHSHISLGFGPLDRIIVSPHMHQIHHSSLPHHLDKNFGVNLSMFDWIFGTAYKPKRGEPLAFGLYRTEGDEDQRFDSLREIYIEPMRRSFRILAKSGGGVIGRARTRSA